MATKRKTKAIAKRKSANSKSAKAKSSGKKLKNKTKKATGSKNESKAKIAKNSGKNIKKTVKKSSLPEIIPHGEDLNLVPVKGNLHPARINESAQKESVFKHNEEVALHQEQQKVKAALSTPNNVKRIFPRPRQS